MIQHHEVSVLEVEPIQLVTRLFGLHHILVDDERGALGVVVDPLSDLPNRAKFAKEIEELVGGYVVAGELLDAVVEHGKHVLSARVDMEVERNVT